MSLIVRHDPLNINVELCYLFGSIKGDGSTYIEKGRSYVIWFCSRNRVYTEKLRDILRKHNFNPWFYVRIDKQFRWILKVSSKLLFELYRDFMAELDFSKMNKENALSFIKGFFDADGYTCYAEVGFSNTDLKLLEDIRVFLAFQGIKSSLRINEYKGETMVIRGVSTARRKNVYELRIFGDRKKFCNLLTEVSG
jgi:intein-encoded DNA endonuclease-like protein